MQNSGRKYSYIKRRLGAMTQIFVNLKRFDVPRNMGGVCPKEEPGDWIKWVLDECISMGLGSLEGVELVFLLPEGLILTAVNKLKEYSDEQIRALKIGSQGVFREDVKIGGNFGAFTTNFPAAAARNMGCSWTIIGHSEERKDKLGIIEAFHPEYRQNPDTLNKAITAVNRLINQEVICALERGINVLLCVGETAEERGEGPFEEQKPRICQSLKLQLEMGLQGIDKYKGRSKFVIGYEPVWAIGPGKIPPGSEYISFVSSYIKQVVKEEFQFDPVVVYGGGLKEENAGMISKIPTIGGGLVALTRFTGEIGFNPDELKKIIDKYME